MLTVDETRRQRLEMLIAQHGGKIANLNEALGYARNETKLARLRNANERTDRPGKIYLMGDALAREIEQKLALDRGWMDTPPGAELFSADTRMQQLYRVAEQLEPYQVDAWLSIGQTLARGAQQPDAAELVSETAQSTPAKSNHTVELETQRSGHGPTLASSSEVRGDSLFAPKNKDPVDGAVHEHNEAGRPARRGHGRGRTGNN
jgi:hypothetical protein